VALPRRVNAYMSMCTRVQLFADEGLVVVQNELLSAMSDAVAKGDEAELKAVTTYVVSCVRHMYALLHCRCHAPMQVRADVSRAV
jgi:hypothetical protein